MAFLTGMLTLLVLFNLSDTPRRKLFDINAALGTAVVMMALGGMLAYQAASSLGKVVSSAMQVPNWRYVAPAAISTFPLLVIIGQEQVNHPERLPWLFPVTNLLIVALPSLVIALVVSQRYVAFNKWSWPVSWREWSSGIIYGAIGATTIAGIINTLYLILMALLLINRVGDGDTGSLARGLPSLPRGWGIAFDISVLSVVAPLNEEFWKGMLVAFFFFRRGGAARCFMWGVLAGAGFNILETFQNSIAIINPAEVTRQQLSEDWWKFATARAGTGAVHSAATGLSALGFYGLFRGQGRYLLGLPGRGAHPRVVELLDLHPLGRRDPQPGGPGFAIPGHPQYLRAYRPLRSLPCCAVGDAAARTRRSSRRGLFRSRDGAARPGTREPCSRGSLGTHIPDVTRRPNDPSC